MPTEDIDHLLADYDDPSLFQFGTDDRVSLFKDLYWIPQFCCIQWVDLLRYDPALSGRRAICKLLDSFHCGVYYVQYRAVFVAIYTSIYTTKFIYLVLVRANDV